MVKHVHGFSIKKLGFFMKWLQRFIDILYGIILKLQMPVACIAIVNMFWFNDKYNNIGQSRFLCPLKGLVVLRSNISLKPNDIYARRIHNG